MIQPALLHATKAMASNLAEGIEYLTADQQAAVERWSTAHAGPFGVFWHADLDGPDTGLAVVVECWRCINWWPHTPV